MRWALLILLMIGIAATSCYMGHVATEYGQTMRTMD